MLKDHCEKCESEDSQVIQHLSHPRKYTEIRTAIANEYTKVHLDSMPEIDITEFTTYLLNEYDYQPVSLCPNCNARKPNKRIRKKPQFLCTDCGSEFEQITNRSLSDMVSNLYQNEEAQETRDKCFTTKDEWRNKHSLLDVRYWLQRKNIEEVYDGTIQRKAFLLYLDDNIKYLSFVDTITACKKCASYYDLNRMELCPICRKNYKGIEYQSCVQCLPEEKRKIAEDNNIELNYNGTHQTAIGGGLVVLSGIDDGNDAELTLNKDGNLVSVKDMNTQEMQLLSQSSSNVT
jgi:hypothetical protein